MLSFLGLTSTASPAKPTSAPQQTTQTQEQKNANPHSAQQHKTQVKPVTPQQTTKQDQKHAKTQDNKQHQSKQQKNATAPTKAVGPTKQTETPKQNQTSKAAPVQQPTKTKSMTPAQQLEMQQILNILIDEDWNDKTNKQPQPTPKQAQKTPKAQAPKPQDAKASKASQKSTTPVQQVPKTALTRKVSMSPAQLQEQKEILHILIDEDWTPPAKKPQTNQKPTTRPGSAKTKQNTPAKTATTQSPPVTQKKAQTHSKLSLSPDQQLEMQQILNILIDDAGKDWKPRNKTVKPHTKQPNQNPSTRPTSAKPRQKTQKATSQTPPATQKSTPAAHRPVPKMNLSPAQQLEMQQILNILIDDAGKDWKPRNKTVKPHVFSKRGSQKLNSRPTSATSKQKTPTQKTSTQSPRAQTTPRPVPKMTLTPAQQVEMQQILNILIDDAGKGWKPRNKNAPKQPIHKVGSKQQGNKPTGTQKPTTQKSTSPKTAPPKATAQQTQKAAPTKPAKLSLTPAQQLEMQQILNILIDDAGKDWKPRNKSAQPVSKHQAPNKTAKETTKPQTPTKAQNAPKPQTPTKQKQPTAKEQPTKAHSTAQQQKATTHIQANKNQRAKLTT
ncbi:hypothetical protein AC1031_018027 [Aphanomyces cochlioides]|nr:hypothetical protein AC1031_018027 [Aphanomyces cochlioides]